MAEEMQKVIDDLRAQLAEQRLRVAALERGENAVEEDLSEEDGGSDVEEGARALPLAKQITFNASKIPDAIKLITSYHGEPKLLAGWIRSVEEKLKFAELACPTEQDRILARPLWSSIIRDKILGEASNVLIIHQVSTNWCDIKEALIEHLGDKRDLHSLITKIMYLNQGEKTITDFYKECRELLTDISAKISLAKMEESCSQELLSNYEGMIMNAFIDGLNGTWLPAFTRNSFPETLAKAYQNAIDQFNGLRRREEKLSHRSKNYSEQHNGMRKKEDNFSKYPQHVKPGTFGSQKRDENFSKFPPYAKFNSGNKPQVPPLTKNTRFNHINYHEEDPEYHAHQEPYNEEASHIDDAISEEIEELNFHFTREPQTER